MAQKSFFTSDLHLSHKLVANTRGFSSIEEMNEKIYRMFDVVEKGDFVYILGDVGWDADDIKKFLNYLIMKKKVDKVVIIEGNHDKNWIGKFELHPRVEIHDTLMLKSQKLNEYRPIFLSHYPHILFDKSHHGAYQLHGHGHADTVDRPLLDALQMGKRLNVNCELNDYKLWSRDDVEEFMKTKPENIDFYLCKGTDRQKERVLKIIKKMGRILKELEIL